MSTENKPRILIAEDFKGSVKVLKRQLSNDFELDVAYDGDEALKLLRSGKHFDLIILDLVMPRLDGFQVMKAMNDEGINVRVLVITAQPLENVERKCVELGARVVLNKPLNFKELAQHAENIIRDAQLSAQGEDVLHPNTGKLLPIRKVNRVCYICGYSEVTGYKAIPEAIEEDWDHGAFPIYHVSKEYDNWDILRNFVTVCPYCLFASADLNDFGESKQSRYPWLGESKQIMVKSIGTRKKMVPDEKDEGSLFHTLYRDQKSVIQTLQLADKCSNGLILGGKRGVYFYQGLYNTLLGTLHHPKGSSLYYRQGLNGFLNQLKQPCLPVQILQSHYFSLVLNMLLHNSVAGKDIMKKVEAIYYDRDANMVSDDEKEWLLRLEHIWKVGVDSETPRRIESFQIKSNYF